MNLNLNTAANIAEVLGVVIVVGGFAFAILQLQQFRIQRRAQAALELVRSFNTPEYVKALHIVLDAPADLSASDCRDCDREFETAVMQVSVTMEVIGLMVHRRMISLEIVWELMGGILLEVWRRVQPWTQVQRQQYDRPKFNEWAQWLADRLGEVSQQCCQEPAFEKYADWEAKEDGPLG